VRFGYANELETSSFYGDPYSVVTAIDGVKYSSDDYLQVDIGFLYRYVKQFALGIGFTIRSQKLDHQPGRAV